MIKFVIVKSVGNHNDIGMLYFENNNTQIVLKYNYFIVKKTKNNEIYLFEDNKKNYKKIVILTKENNDSMFKLTFNSWSDYKGTEIIEYSNNKLRIILNDREITFKIQNKDTIFNELNKMYNWFETQIM
jgi:hypothetical protein